jgi:transcriptional regulator with XRE-family HTH domain
MEKQELLTKLGGRIRAIRIEKSVTQKQLAHAIGKDQQSIQRLEAGNMNPTFYYLTEIAKGLDVPVERLVEHILK